MKNTTRHFVTGCAILTTVALTARTVAASTEDSAGTWLAMGRKLSPEAAPTVARADPGSPAPPAKSPPLPFHTIEGYSGGGITPMAYLCNAGVKGCVCSRPSAAYTFVNLGSKKLNVFSVTHVLWNRVELGYAYNYLTVGSLYDDVKKAGLDMGRDHVHLHHFNVRFNLLPENSFDLPLPAITGGVHFKYNDGIKSIDKSLGGAFTSIGYEKDNGVDYTLTATKMFPKLAFGRPVILTGGLRFSNAAQLGFFGFGRECNLTFEGSVAYLPIDQVCLAYEFRGKDNPFNRIPELVDREHNWHAFSASWIINDRLTITGLCGMFGNVGNARSDCSMGIQAKYEF